jgi:hypothetical protein
MITKAQLKKAIAEVLEEMEAKPSHFQLTFYCKTFGITQWNGKLSDRVCSDPKCATCAGFSEALQEEVFKYSSK